MGTNHRAKACVALLLVFLLANGCIRKAPPVITLPEDKLPDRILIHEGHDSVCLLNNGGEWQLDARDLQVNPSLQTGHLERMLYAATHLEIHSVIAPEKEAGAGRMVQYFRGKKELLSYRLIFREGACVLQLPGRETAALVYLPAFPDTDLDVLFSPRRTDYFSHMLVDLRPSEVSSVEIRKPGCPAYRFSQDEEGKTGWWIDDPVIMEAGRGPTENDMRLLLSYAAAISYEEDAALLSGTFPGLPTEASLDQELPRGAMALILISARDSVLHRIEVYPYQPDRDGQADLFRALVRYNDRPGYLLVNYVFLDVLMRDPSRYFGGLQ